jgi:hypothetical protein
MIEPLTASVVARLAVIPSQGGKLLTFAQNARPSDDVRDFGIPSGSRRSRDASVEDI